ncbi:4504_t:CDS:1, partial [Paraglomus brasilianum]
MNVDDLFDEDTEVADEASLPTRHRELRQIAIRNTEKMRKKIRDRLLKSKSSDKYFEVGSVVLSIPRID